MPVRKASDAGLHPLVVVTGASEGLGLRIAHRFAASGCDLLLVARKSERLNQAAAEIAQRHRVRATAVAVDLVAPGAAEAIAAAALDAGGYVDILVNNAGVGLAGPFTDATPEEIDNLIDLNVRALTALTRHFLPGMRVRRRGGVLNIASLGGYTPGPWQAAYYASKAYVVSFSEALASEVAADGVRVTVVAPGPIATRFHAKIGAENSFYRLWLLSPSPGFVAVAAVTGYRMGLRLVLPDVWSLVMMPFLRILPRRLTVPLVGWLLQPRRREVDDARSPGA